MSPSEDQDEKVNGSGFPLFLGLSLFIHALFFAGIFFMPDLGAKHSQLPPAITVDLVSLSLPPAGKSPESHVAQEAVKAPVKKKKSVKKAVVVRKKKKTPKKSVKKTAKKSRKIKKRTVRRTVRSSSKVIDSAMERLKSKVKEEEKKQPELAMAEALSRLEKKVEDDRGRRDLESRAKVDPLQKRLEALKAKSASLGGVSLSGASGNSSGGRVATLEDIYRHNVASEVKEAWAFPDHLAGDDEGLQAEVSFDVLPGGELADVRLVLPSGNKYLDESAVNAVKKASPFAPHLSGISKSRVRVRVKFTPRARD